MYTKPTLIVDETKCRANIKAMADKAKGLGIAYRPHFKTHQSLEVGRWFRDFGIDRIAVSSLPMADFFATDGWSNITIAFPFVKQQANAINELATKVDLQLVVSSFDNAKNLSKLITSRVQVLIEIDSGQGRTGIQPYDLDSIDSIINMFIQSSHIEFTGFLTHAGHSYGISARDLRELNNQTISRILPLKNRYPNTIISYGDTPTSTICEQFMGIDELRPGNNAFFDMQQVINGICTPEQIAIALACPIVAQYPQRNLIAIWGGAVHLSKDFYIDSNGNKSFGAICRMNDDGLWCQPIDGLYLESISQEHGMVRSLKPEAFETLGEDDYLVVLPAHSCLTVDAMGVYFSNGKGFIPTLAQNQKTL
jgi:D-serine deaminase-like pyridoxal phosphate-dependent protein